MLHYLLLRHSSAIGKLLLLCILSGVAVTDGVAVVRARWAALFSYLSALFLIQCPALRPEHWDLLGLGWHILRVYFVLIHVL